MISNQGFVTALDNDIVDHPSDDPDTPTPNDPTRDIVGNLPLLYAEKRVELSVDLGSPGIVDPGDVLRYTITVQNSAASRPPASSCATPFRRIRPTSRIRRCSTDCRSVSRTAARRRSPRASTSSSSDLTPPLPDAGAARSRRGRSRPSVRPAGERRHARGHRDQQPGRGRQRRAAGPSDRWRRQSRDGPRTDHRRGRRGQQLSITKQVAVVGGGAAVPGARSNMS